MLLPQPLPAGAEQVTVTDTATSLLALIRTAASNAGFQFDPKVNFFRLQTDSGDLTDGIRVSTSFTPTAAIGQQIVPLQSEEFNVLPEDILLIRTGGDDVLVNVEVFQKTMGNA